MVVRFLFTMLFSVNIVSSDDSHHVTFMIFFRFTFILSGLISSSSSSFASAWGGTFVVVDRASLYFMLYFLFDFVFSRQNPNHLGCIWLLYVLESRFYDLKLAKTSVKWFIVTETRIISIERLLIDMGLPQKIIEIEYSRPRMIHIRMYAIFSGNCR